jgi:hypothetical protein
MPRTNNPLSLVVWGVCVFMLELGGSSTTRMSYEGERANDARTRDDRERAPPHWLNPLGSMKVFITGTNLMLLHQSYKAQK